MWMLWWVVQAVLAPTTVKGSCTELDGKTGHEVALEWDGEGTRFHGRATIDDDETVLDGVRRGGKVELSLRDPTTGVLRYEIAADAEWEDGACTSLTNAVARSYTSSMVVKMTCDFEVASPDA
ncbi:MAG: hypothetical protein AAGA56_03390 [Myxococcota bacterium]